MSPVSEYVLLNAAGRILLRGSKADMTKWSKQFPGSRVWRGEK